MDKESIVKIAAALRLAQDALREIEEDEDDYFIGMDEINEAIELAEKAGY